MVVSRRALEKGHDITLITTKGSPMAGKCNPKTIKRKINRCKGEEKTSIIVINFNYIRNN